MNIASCVRHKSGIPAQFTMVIEDQEEQLNKLRRAPCRIARGTSRGMNHGNSSSVLGCHSVFGIRFELFHCLGSLVLLIPPTLRSLMIHHLMFLLLPLHVNWISESGDYFSLGIPLFPSGRRFPINCSSNHQSCRILAVKKNSSCWIVIKISCQGYQFAINSH